VHVSVVCMSVCEESRCAGAGVGVYACIIESGYG